MKKLTFLLGCMLLFAYVGTARAARIDIGDPNCSSYSGSAPLTPVPSLPFDFTVNSSGGGVFAFCNETGSIWKSVDLKVSFWNGFVNTPFNCTSNIFLSCGATVDNGIIDIFFSDPKKDDCNGEDCGVPKNFFLVIDLNNAESGTGDWLPGLTFTGADVNAPTPPPPPVPEPSTLLLVGSGAMAVWRRRRSG